MMHATAGRSVPTPVETDEIFRLQSLQLITTVRLSMHSFIGVGEIVLLPLDVLKIKRQ